MVLTLSKRSFQLMSEKQLEKLLTGFVQSSKSLSSLQEGILSLHGVMEQFKKTTEDFSLKNEMDTLLPSVKEHFVQVSDMYNSIADNVKNIQNNTEIIQVTGKEMVPAYQKLQGEVVELQAIQGEMVDTILEISASVQAMQVMQQELQLQMVEFRQMMVESKEMQGQLLEMMK